MRAEDMVQDPTLGTKCIIEPKTLLALLSYYRTKRIGTQGRFFQKRLNQFRAHHRRTWRIPSWLILGSVIFALAHFAVDFAHKGHSSLSTILILMAAGLPVIAAGLRTFRSTYEFARNAMRYEAKLMAPRQIDRNLEAELKRAEIEPRRIFHDLWCCGQIMEFETPRMATMAEEEW